MAGRKQFDPDEALDRAVDVFWRRGYDGASVQDLVDGTGLQRGSLYGTFGSKEQLFLASLERYGGTVARALFDAMQEHPDDHVAAVRGLFDAIVGRMAAGRHPQGCLVTHSAVECFAGEPALQDAVRRALDAQVSAVRTVFVAAGERGDLPEGVDVDHLTAFVVATAQSLAVMHRAGADAPTLRGIAETALRAVPTVQRAA